MSDSSSAMGLDVYGDDLAAIHADGFLEIARAAAAETIGRLPPGRRALDLGCGDGTTAALLTAAGHEALGEVLAYVHGGGEALHVRLRRLLSLLRAGGLLLFDLPARSRHGP